MTYLRDYGKRIYLPIYVFYLAGGDKNILVDTGLEQFMIPDGAEEKCGFEILEFEDALASVDLKPEDIDIIIHTHLHNDHCENDYKCTNAEVYVQQKEYDFMLEPHPVDHRYYPDILDDVKVVKVEGDKRIVDGIEVIFSPGHSVGGQSVAVNTAEGRAIITGFCCNDKNFPSAGPAITQIFLRPDRLSHPECISTLPKPMTPSKRLRGWPIFSCRCTICQSGGRRRYRKRKVSDKAFGCWRLEV
jgi:hypothetical protein